MMEQINEIPQNPDKQKREEEQKPEEPKGTTIISGLHKMPDAKVAGRTVDEIEKGLPTFNINPTGERFVDGKLVHRDYIMKATDKVLEFVKETGQKGFERSRPDYIGSFI